MRKLASLLIFLAVSAIVSPVFSQDGQTINLGSSSTQLRSDHFNSSSIVALVPEGTKLSVLDGSRQGFVKVRARLNGKTYVGWIARYYTDIEFIPSGTEPDREYLKGLQRDLTRAGFYAGDIDGRRMAVLIGGINRFLNSIGEQPTSSLTDEQRAKLTVVAQTSSLRLVDLRRPVQPTQAEVLGIQKYLLQLGYRIGSADGVVGRKTRRAIEAYQRSLGGSATGVLTLGQILQLHRTATIRETGAVDPEIQDRCGQDSACAERVIWNQINAAYAVHKANLATSDGSSNRATSSAQPPLNPIQKGLLWFLQNSQTGGYSGSESPARVKVSSGKCGDGARWDLHREPDGGYCVSSGLELGCLYWGSNPSDLVQKYCK